MRYYQKITFVLLALFCLPAWAQQDEVILVDHTITLSGDVIASKQQAYESVLVKALLMASQSIASPELFQNNYQLLREKFAEDPKSYVQDYQYLERTTRGQQYYLKLKVDPKWIVLKNKLADWGFLGFQSKPNIQVEPFVIHQKEHQKITTSGEYWSSKVVSHLRRMSLPAKTVEATSQVVPNTYTVQSKIVRSGGQKVEFAFLLAHPKLASKQQFVLTLDKTTNEDMMAGLITLALIENIMPLWFESQGNQRVYEVRLQNVPQYALQQEFKKVMQSQRGIVQSIEDKKYMRGATIFQVHILQESLDLARFLASLQVSGKKIEVVEQQGRIVAIELR